MIWRTLALNYLNIQYLRWTHVRTHPVVQVVMQALVTDAELKLLQETLVIHHIKSNEDVNTILSVRREKNVILSPFNTDNCCFECIDIYSEDI